MLGRRCLYDDWAPYHNDNDNDNGDGIATPRHAMNMPGGAMVETHISRKCALQGSNPRAVAHKTIALTTELSEPWLCSAVGVFMMKDHRLHH